MGMCPYCAEDVPAESKSCWKCGTELSGEGETSFSAATEPAIEQRKKPKDRPVGECPHCGAIVGVKSLRCNDCGRAVRTTDKRNWVPAIWTAFGLVLFALVAGLIYGYVDSLKAPPDPGRSTPEPVGYDQLLRMYRADSAKARTKKLELWEQHHKGKFVRWEMTLLAIREDGSVALGTTEDVSAATPHAVLELKDTEAVKSKGLMKGKMYLYSASLDHIEGTTVYLTKAVIE